MLSFLESTVYVRYPGRERWYQTQNMSERSTEVMEEVRDCMVDSLLHWCDKFPSTTLPDDFDTVIIDVIDAIHTWVVTTLDRGVQCEITSGRAPWNIVREWRHRTLKMWNAQMVPYREWRGAEGFFHLEIALMAQVQYVVVCMVDLFPRTMHPIEFAHEWLNNILTPEVRRSASPREFLRQVCHTEVAVMTLRDDHVVDCSREEKTGICTALQASVDSFLDRVFHDIDRDAADRVANELLLEEERERAATVSKRERRKRKKKKSNTPDPVTEELVDPPVEETGNALETPMEMLEETLDEPVTASGTLEERDESLCVVCMDGDRTHLIAPCGHKCLCEACVSLVGNECPMCRGGVQLICRVFG